ncbi:MAG: XamI family restriction endonuclease, partial [Burkholderiales bacterium]
MPARFCCGSSIAASAWCAASPERRRALQSLFRQLAPFDPQNTDIEIARKILTDPQLESALRYVAGPPVSKDDLGVLATRRRERIGTAAIRTNPTLANEVLALICRLADSERFPWLARGRKPKPHEIKQALRATAALHAAQSMQTERHAYGKVAEGLLRDLLLHAPDIFCRHTGEGRYLRRAWVPAGVYPRAARSADPWAGTTTREIRADFRFITPSPPSRL